MTIIFDKDEHVISEVRKHWFVLAKQMSFAFFAFFIPAILYAVVSVLPIEINIPGNGIVLFLFFYACWISVIWMVIFILWTDYYLDVWIITNKKLIDIEQKGLFSREISVMNLEKIQDVTSEQVGLVATMLGFGNLTVQTAGKDNEFTIYDVKDPNNFRKQLNNVLTKNQESRIL